jgi:hypothetical protein
MSIYRKIINSKTNVPMYFKDKKMISKKIIPAEILQILEDQEQFDDNPPPEKPIKVCIFCGQPASHNRLVNLQTVDLCEKHYYDTNMGEIAKQLSQI